MDSYETQSDTIIDSLEWLFGPEKHYRELPENPADVFAAAAYLLQRSGAYVRVLRDARIGAPEWKRKVYQQAEAWREFLKRKMVDEKATYAEFERMAELAAVWKDFLKLAKGYPEKGPLAPKPGTKHVPFKISSIRDEREKSSGTIFRHLMHLLCVSDEASAFIGSYLPDALDMIYMKNLFKTENVNGFSSTLCKKIHPGKLKVLPKLHTPDTGISIRSLSHHLALSLPSEVFARWSWMPNQYDDEKLNLLIIPFPWKVHPDDFGPVEQSQSSQKYGTFGYAPLEGSSAEDLTRIQRLIDTARARLYPEQLDGVVFPELALTSGQADAVMRAMLAGVRAGDSKKESRPSFLVTGIHGDIHEHVVKCDDDPNFGAVNKYRFYIPFTKNIVMCGEQNKHHRWKLDASQLNGYGIGSLAQDTQWWEHTHVDRRVVEFITLRHWLTTCVLICEDLARQEPVSDLIRSVGPNLVIALLMDGPQLTSRWSARYATVLADDPGCSVLTLTSLGMVKLSNQGRTDGKLTVALWKDTVTGVREITLPEGCEAAILRLKKQDKVEVTTDGRSETKKTSLVVLRSVEPISIERALPAGERKEHDFTKLDTITASKMVYRCLYSTDTDGLSFKEYIKVNIVLSRLKSSELAEKGAELRQVLRQSLLARHNISSYFDFSIESARRIKNFFAHLGFPKERVDLIFEYFRDVADAENLSANSLDRLVAVLVLVGDSKCDELCKEFSDAEIEKLATHTQDAYSKWKKRIARDCARHALTKRLEAKIGEYFSEVLTENIGGKVIDEYLVEVGSHVFGDTSPKKE